MTYSLKEIMPLISEAVIKNKRSLHLTSNTTVRLSGTLKTFHHWGVVCAKCGLAGTVFREVEHENNIHLRLFGIKNGQEIMMTKDHIIPRSVGGSNNFNNIQTMCCECNSTKQNEVNEKFIENARYSYKSIKDFIFNTYPQGPTRDRFSRDFSKLIRKIRKNNMISGFLCGDVDEILEYIRDIKIKYGFNVPLQKLKRLPGKDKRKCFLCME